MTSKPIRRFLEVFTSFRFRAPAVLQEPRSLQSRAAYKTRETVRSPGVLCRAPLAVRPRARVGAFTGGMRWQSGAAAPGPVARQVQALSLPNSTKQRKRR